MIKTRKKTPCTFSFVAEKRDWKSDTFMCFSAYYIRFAWIFSCIFLAKKKKSLCEIFSSSGVALF